MFRENKWKRGWVWWRAILQWLQAADVSLSLHFWSWGLGLNNRQPSNIKHYQAWGIFLLGFLIFHCFLACLCLWSLIPLTKIWSCYCFSLPPKLIRHDGTSLLFLSLSFFFLPPFLLLILLVTNNLSRPREFKYTHPLYIYFCFFLQTFSVFF